MPAMSPLEVDSLFARALEDGDLEGLVALYESEAVVVAATGTASGLVAIRTAVQPFIDLKPTGVVLDGKVAADLGDVVILYDDWHAEGHGPGGSIPLSGKAVEVVRRQPDGSWKFIFDDPNARG